ncbi:pellino E3 ubiquitin protein ligase family member 2 [Rhinolophus ferrumequinum]|uniref:Pellino E3 ubiquitin protein ligase family member 2 n=1 Tax=Rhinolophus ferrumequinum TaxID=59479 RepID=A0A7J7XRP6_RHIFE|nr:pellino E3 ubiquitin protein ligase family member 2 [Rhinolophus ferrumequinum]
MFSPGQEEHCAPNKEPVKYGELVVLGPTERVRGCLPLFFLLLPFRSKSDNSSPVPQEKGSPGP